MSKRKQLDNQYHADPVMLARVIEAARTVVQRGDSGDNPAARERTRVIVTLADLYAQALGAQVEVDNPQMVDNPQRRVREIGAALLRAIPEGESGGLSVRFCSCGCGSVSVVTYGNDTILDGASTNLSADTLAFLIRDHVEKTKEDKQP